MGSRSRPSYLLVPENTSAPQHVAAQIRNATLSPVQKAWPQEAIHDGNRKYSKHSNMNKAQKAGVAKKKEKVRNPIIILPVDSPKPL